MWAHAFIVEKHKCLWNTRKTICKTSFRYLKRYSMLHICNVSKPFTRFSPKAYRTAMWSLTLRKKSTFSQNFLNYDIDLIGGQRSSRNYLGKMPMHPNICTQYHELNGSSAVGYLGVKVGDKCRTDVKTYRNIKQLSNIEKLVSTSDCSSELAFSSCDLS